MDYESLKIKEYDLWDLYLHEHQDPYIGRCYAAAKRENADVVTDMNPAEAFELFSFIVPEWYSAVVDLYGASRPNVAILGNTWNHLHAHLIPRFKEPKSFHGLELIDPNPTGNYVPFEKKEVGDQVLQKIRKNLEIMLHLGK